MKAKVTIQRGAGYNDNFMGEVLVQTDTHWFVAHGPVGEWFAVSSRVVNCVVVSE